MSRLVFFGNERIATGVTTTVPTLQALLDNGYEVAAIVLAQGAEVKSRKQRPLEIAEVATAHGIPVLSPEKLADITDELKALEPDAGVLIAYGKLIPQSVIDIFPHGIINIHPSLLPLHRGSIPLEAAMLQGDTQTGVSLMQLVKAWDAGPYFAQTPVILTGNETKQDLADRLLKLGGDMLIQHLPAILSSELEPTPQNDAEATYDQRLAKDSGTLNEDDWDRPTIEIERMIRALAGWPRVRTRVAEADIIITSAHAISGAGMPGVLWSEVGQFGIFTKDGILVIDQLIPAGKKEMSAQAFLAGHNFA